MFFLTGLSSSNRTIAYAAFAIIAFAAFGVAAAQPRQLSQPVPSNPSAAGSAPKAESASIGAAAPSLAMRFFGRDLRKPRLPRHRSERPSTFSAENESLTVATVIAILSEDLHRPFLAEIVTASPLSGHPHELLRPPSARIESGRLSLGIGAAE
jgi:hypothetical protein